MMRNMAGWIGLLKKRFEEQRQMDGDQCGVMNHLAQGHDSFKMHKLAKSIIGAIDRGRNACLTRMMHRSLIRREGIGLRAVLR